MLQAVYGICRIIKFIPAHVMEFVKIMQYILEIYYEKCEAQYQCKFKFQLVLTLNSYNVKLLSEKWANDDDIKNLLKEHTLFGNQIIDKIVNSKINVQVLIK